MLIAIYCLLPVAYCLLRLPGLMALPLFNDEAVYLLRAQRFPLLLTQTPYDSGTLPDGKLIQELLLAALALLPGDPLLPARMLSVACGLGTIAALARCGQLLGRPGAGLLAGLFYALAPLAQIHDRLAIPDSMLTMVGAFLLAASITYALGERTGRREALGIGVLLAAAALVKLPGLLLAALPILAVLFLAEPGARWHRLEQLRLSLIVALAALAALAPFHYGGAERQKIGGEADRIALISQNIGLIGGWLVRYLPGPLLLLPLIALGVRHHGPRFGGRSVSPSSRPPAIMFLLTAGLVLPAAFAVAGGTLTSRYILPAWPVLLLAIAIGAETLWQIQPWRLVGRGLVALSIGTSLVWCGFFALRYSNDPRAAPMAAGDSWQYTQSWTAGYGLAPLLERVRDVGQEGGPIILALHDQSRLASLAGQIYLGDRSAVQIVSINLLDQGSPEQLRAFADQAPTYLLADSQVASVYRLRTRFSGLTLVKEVMNPGGRISFLLFVQESR